jgi:hypothetical protein
MTQTSNTDIRGQIMRLIQNPLVISQLPQLTNLVSRPLGWF